MKDLIDEIIVLLSTEGGKLSEALIKTKILLHKLGNKELVHWVNNELNGYPNKESVPEYRKITCQVLANATNMAYQATRHPLPLGHLTDDQRESIESSMLDQSLAVLEQFTADPDGTLTAIIPAESYGFLGKGLDSSYQIQMAWCEMSKSEVIQVLTQVRSRLLDFILELSDEFSDSLSEDQVKEKIENIDTNNLFNNAIFGDNTSIIVGSDNSQVITNTNAKGDFQQLANLLQKNGVEESDIDELEQAIAEDEEQIDNANKEYGPAVKNWLSNMMRKAVEASWDIELGVVSSLLATALNNYYGWI